MRDVLDCGVLLAPGHESTMGAWIAGHQAKVTRVRLHPVSLAPPALAEAPPDSLAQQALSLRRYDACILPVAPSSLAWARMALQQARGALTTPVLLLIHDVKAPAILDLLSLGAADFISQPVCVESLRVRLVRMARRGAVRRAGVSGSVHEHPVNYLGEHAEVQGAEHAAYPPHASRAGAARPKVPADIVEHALSSLRHQYRRGVPETFRAAKAQVVNGFEREYIRHALSRHGGNVAQAARACAKHRRAFWALMRKHGIEAAPYRQAALAAARMHDMG
ncbi:helix-turn-helix domain-containing protein [Achromobacter animicus]|uniref:helix-turn-helix domain-containing protein n=1 Tax=Achromobacter animicus TaxID=1389935 RepID=UPI0028AEB43D|nr:helix-turn-helix domain-containing protein [Achromobacter animicus]